jgi:predicted DNA-binding transcriptional regulator AlpA
MLRRYIYNGKSTQYLIDNEGKVFSEISQKYLSPYKNKGGYLNVDLYIDGKRYKKGIHALVAETYISNPMNKPTVNHNDACKENNNKNNLRWATQSEQNYHINRIGKRQSRKGEGIHFSKYKEIDVIKACECLSEGLSVNETSEITGIPPKTLYEIRLKQIWKHISTKYTFPKSEQPGSKNHSIYLKDDILKLIDLGYDNRKICIELNIERDEKNCKFISDMRYRRKEVQRPSNEETIKYSSSRVDS